MPAVALTVALTATIVCLGPEPLLKSYDAQTPAAFCKVIEPGQEVNVTPTDVFMALPNGILVMTGYDEDDLDLYFLAPYDLRGPRPADKVSL